MQVNNINNGLLIFNHCNVPPIRMDVEINAIGLYGDLAGFWGVTGCSEGIVAFVSKPQSQQGKTFLQMKKVSSAHKGDIVTLDISKAN